MRSISRTCRRGNRVSAFAAGHESVSGTSETCGPAQNMSVHRGRPEVTGGGQNDAIDPDVWSGRALQGVFVELSVCGLASMYPASDWSFCSGPPWISARMRSHYRGGVEG